MASKGSRGDCFDNAPAESFWATLQTELLDKQVFLTRAVARREVFDFIEGFYHRTRRNSACGNHSPEGFERRWRLGIDLTAVTKGIGFVTRHNLRPLRSPAPATRFRPPPPLLLPSLSATRLSQPRVGRLWRGSGGETADAAQVASLLSDALTRRSRQS